MAAPHSYSGFVFGLVIRILVCALLAVALERYLHFSERLSSVIGFVAALVWLYFYFKRQETKK